ncbi:MAG: 5-methyltetrahydropteroyltriglutamate--homocysteine S-methyltransferase [Candidatus Omnitrophota bacterium]|nr:MAG: 5-methyltetrahydropteroyltriglutamate--homocysteine S-methyltransferase [Candidatus Omnitrophota bacterium]HDN85620.1 5-methyltetrahydropteroyltriglutamate--homocysteine S-methyltransferase [Candidatus Omnitrophota bacterium]
MHIYAYGFPRLGRKREFKTAIESFWSGRINQDQLIEYMENIEKERIHTYKKYVDFFPLGEFTYYDNLFDTALIFGVYRVKNLSDYFEYARGKKALELKKYFNTNYHYLVPQIPSHKKFYLSWNKPLFYLNNFFSFHSQPLYIIGPYTFLKLSRAQGNFKSLIYQLSQVYKLLLEKLYTKGAKLIHLEEPAFVLDISYPERKIIIDVYRNLLKTKVRVNLITYYESVDFLKSLYDLPFHALSLDFVAGINNLALLKKYGFPKDKHLICGVVDGRGVRRSDIFKKVKLVENIKKIAHIDSEKIIIAPSCPLFHLPLTLEDESRLDEKIKSRISFAQERLYELSLIKKVFFGETKEAEVWYREDGKSSFKKRDKEFATLTWEESRIKERKIAQKTKLSLPLFPTTTIGSFPQDKQLRKIRRDYRKGNISLGSYKSFIKDKIEKLIRFQEKIGLDVLVHGEFERSDMVEFFAQNLGGFLTTDNGWVISYGTRVYRPPIIYEEVKRITPLTVEEISYAQKLTLKPVKGIITGPITIVAWSYNLRDLPSYAIAFELASALNQEAKELVEKGIKIIQIDEPAFKEFSPLKKAKRDFYFSWAVRAFNITTKLPKEVQVHTHMCYSQFQDIIKWLVKMNFDVITIETAREGAQIIDHFKKVRFKKSIGPGVWDIHSRYPASKKSIESILEKAIGVFGKDRVWVNPDCGLKTRDWPEVELSLQRMVEVAKKYRKKFQQFQCR